MLYAFKKDHRVHATYTREPPHPGQDWTRFVCISDTHSHIFEIPDGDVLLHSGDLSSYGEPENMERTMEWIRGLPHPTKILIAGNHDLCLDLKWPEKDLALLKGPASLEKVRALMRSEELQADNVHYLEHEAITITRPSGKTWKIYGSPAAPKYAKGAFQYKGPLEAKEIYERIPEDTDILLTHTPPYRVLDSTKKGSHAGCQELKGRIRDLQRCRLHVFGHIHEAFGAESSHSGRVSVNAALLHAPNAIIVDLKN